VSSAPQPRGRMSLITNILFPVDFSPSSIAMASYVKRAAILFAAKVSLIHVFDPASYNGFELFLRQTKDIAQDHHEIARRRLDSFLENEFPLSEYPRIVVAGDAATQIAQVAKRGFDLIIMPTHAGTFRRMLLGSTTAKVLNDADCPVLTTRHAETVTPHPLEHREWLCAIDLSPDSERVLRFANQAAAEARAKLYIIHAIQGGDPDLPAQPDLEAQIHPVEREETRERIAALQKKLGSSAPVNIVVGSVKAALIDAARRYDADGLIIGRGPQSGARGRLRDLTYAIVRDSPFPVLSV
jgi:nucleotide-binding universal stress UspA family protein